MVWLDSPAATRSRTLSGCALLASLSLLLMMTVITGFRIATDEPLTILTGSPDTAELVMGAEVAVDCLRDAIFIRCGDPTPYGDRGFVSRVDRFPPLLYVISVPLLGLGLAPTTTYYVVMSVTCLAMWFLLMAPWLAPRRHVLHRRRHLWAALVIPSPLLVYAGTGWSEVLAAALLAAVVVATVRRDPPWVLAIAVFAASLARDFAPVLVTILVAGLLLADREPARWRRVVPAVAAAVFGAIAVTISWNLFRFGVPQSASYATTPLVKTAPAVIWANMAVVLVSPNGGALLGWPGLVPGVGVAVRGVQRTLRRERLALLVLSAAMGLFVLVLASWFSPIGWNAWGPRLFLGAGPGILLAFLAVGRPLAGRPLRWAAVVVAVAALAGAPNLLAHGDRHLVDRWFAGPAVRPAIASAVNGLCEVDGEGCVLYLAFFRRPTLMAASIAHGTTGMGMTWLILGSGAALLSTLAWVHDRPPTIRRVVRLDSLPLEHPTSRALERALNDEIVVRYGADGPEEPHDAAQFAPPAGAFVVAWLQVDGGDEVAVACGGIRRLDDDRCELKRMYVAPEARGRGIARQLLERLEDEAGALGYGAVWLETGTEQPEAIALYESSGYELVENFGRYKDEPKVRSFAKSLSS